MYFQRIYEIKLWGACAKYSLESFYFSAEELFQNLISERCVEMFLGKGIIT